MKRKIKILLFFIGLFFLGFMPNNVEALQCKYDIRFTYYDPSCQCRKPEDKSYEFIFKINTNSENPTVELPNIDGEVVDKDEAARNPYYRKFWKFKKGFSNFYLEQAQNSDGTFYCPNIVIRNQGEEMQFVNQKLAPSTSDYYQFSPSETIAESTDGAKVEQISDTCSVPVIVLDTDGITDKSYTLSFKIGNNHKKYWAVNDSADTTITEESTSLIINNQNINFYLSKGLLSAVYKNNSLKVSCPEKVFACKRPTINDNRILISYDLYLSSRCSLGGEYLDDTSLDGMNQSITCEGLFTDKSEGSVYWLLQKVLGYIKLIGPILVVLLSSVDFIKAVMSSDENAMKVAQKKLMVRLVAAIALFLLPSLIQLIISLLGGIIDSNCLIQ